MDAAERALLEKSVRDVLDAAGATSAGTVDGALAGLGWPDMLEAEPRDAIAVVFEALGATNAPASALDDVVCSALGREPNADLAVVLPAFDTWDAPGRIEGDRLRAAGLATSRAARATEVLVVCDAGTRTVLPKLNGQCILPGSIPGGSSLPNNPGHIANTGQVVGGITDASGNLQPVVFQSGVVARITAAQTPFDPPSPNPGVTPGWSGEATSNNLHGLITALGPNDNGSNTLYLFTPIAIHDETSPGIQYSSGWTHTALAGAYGGFVEQSSTSGATATLTFTGVSVSVIGVRGPGLGSASIQIDGKSKGTVSEAGTAKTRVRLDRIFFATPGTHTLRIDVQSGTFKLDAITVTPH